MLSTSLIACGLQDVAWPANEREEKTFQSRKSANRQKKKQNWLKKLDKTKKRNGRAKQTVSKEKKEKRLLQNKEPSKGRKLTKKQRTNKHFNFVCRLLLYAHYGTPMDQ